MALADRILTLKLVSDVSDIDRGTKRARSRLSGLGSWAKAAGIGIAIQGVEKLGDALGDAWAGFRSGQKVAAQLGVVWKRMGLRGSSLQKTIDKISKRTKVLGTSDDEAVAAFTKLIQSTGDSGKALSRLRIAQDLVANGSAPNLEAAIKLIQGAANGSAKVVDKFGLTSKTAAGRIRELGDGVKGAAQKAASLDPFGVLIGKMSEDLEGIVGAFASGDFSGIVDAFKTLGQDLSDALFGRIGTGPHHKRVPGLVDMVGGWGKTIADGILKGIGDVDWADSLAQTLNTALAALQTAGANGALSTLAVIGGAIGLAIATAAFAVGIFTTAASLMFGLPVWLATATFGSALWLIGHTIGVAIAGAAFALDVFTGGLASAMTGVATAAGLTGGALDLALVALGGALGIAIVAALIAYVGLHLPDLLAQTIRDILGTNIPLGPGDLPWKNKAQGGPVGGGMPYIVGERGPELFVPAGSGRILPAGSSWSGAGGVTINISMGVGDPVAVGREVDRVLRAYQGRLGTH